MADYASGSEAYVKWSECSGGGDKPARSSSSSRRSTSNRQHSTTNNNMIPLIDLIDQSDDLHAPVAAPSKVPLNRSTYRSCFLFASAID